MCILLSDWVVKFLSVRLLGCFLDDFKVKRGRVAAIASGSHTSRDEQKARTKCFCGRMVGDIKSGWESEMCNSMVSYEKENIKSLETGRKQMVNEKW